MGAFSHWSNPNFGGIDPATGRPWILYDLLLAGYGGRSTKDGAEALSPVMRQFLDGLRGVHRFAPPPGVDETPEYRELMRKRTLVSEHPIVRVHPETGERTLFVSPSFLKSIVGLSPRVYRQRFRAEGDRFRGAA